MDMYSNTSISFLSSLSNPNTDNGKRYFSLLTFTVICSILLLFIEHEYPTALPIGSPQLWLIELFFLLVFSLDIGLQLKTINRRSPQELAQLFAEILATLPSLLVVLQPLGIIDSNAIDMLVLLRLFRLLRLVRLLRVGHQLTEVFGTSVLTLVFGTMAVHLSIRVLLLELNKVTDFDIFTYSNSPSLSIAVTSVGAVFGIALAITFGIVKRKQLEITELHRQAMDNLAAFERDIELLGKEQHNIPFTEWRSDLQKFLNEQLSYSLMKQHTNRLLHQIRVAIIDRPSMDVPYHRGLVPTMTAFFSKTQLVFHPAFYKWMNRIAHLYFLLILFATVGITGIVVQMLVIYVFQGLVVVIDDMDHTIDTEVVIFNAKILDE